MVKSKNMMYVQDINHLPFKNLTDCLKYIEKELKPIKYAGILHDKDINKDGTKKQPHIHVMLQFENARSINRIAKLLNDQPQYIEQWKGDSTNGYSYLIHATTNSQDQYQYDIDKVESNFDYVTLLENAKKNILFTTSQKDEIIIKGLLDNLYLGNITREKVEKQLSGSQYAKSKNRIEAVCQKRIEFIAEEWRKDMRENNQSIEVIWIYGDSGVGKTRLAKDLASKYEKDYFISGSSRDPFQHYKGQQLIIMDELRPSTFHYSDLLKMFDPFNEDVMGASRYYDKPLTADTFIVTSPYNPQKFYKKTMEETKKLDKRTDSFKQLARRLDLVLRLSISDICFATYDTKENNFFIEKSSKVTNPYIKTTINEVFLQNEKAESLYKKVINRVL